MNISKQIIIKLYATCYIMAKKLFGKERSWLVCNDDEVDVPMNTNLCSMVRTIIIWMPIYLILFLAAIGGTVYTVFILPATLGGAMGYVNTYIIPGGIIGLIVLIIWGLMAWREKHNKNKESITDKDARHEAGDYTIAEIGVEWVHAIHDKTCPLVTFIDEPVAAEPTPSPSSVDVDDNDPVADPEPPEEIKEWMEKVILPKPFNINVFLAKWLPSMWLLVAAGVSIVVVTLVNLGMAQVMEHEPVVFAKAECVASYDVETWVGKLMCGEYETVVNQYNILGFVNDTVILKKKPYCSVEKGTYTGDMTFKCDYE